MRNIDLQFDGKIPFYVKLKEAKLRNLKLTKEENNLVGIHDKFDEIRKHENELNLWISEVTRQTVTEKVKKQVLF